MKGGPGAHCSEHPSLVGLLSSSAGELNVKDPRLKISPGFPNHRAISLFASFRPMVEVRELSL
jgi:hypothetical protein